MMQLQVKAKSGLHAGAVWNLSKSHITLGGSASADIFLCDPDMPDSLMTLHRRGRRYVIEGMDPLVKLISHDDRKIESEILASQTATIDFRHIQLEVTLVNTGGQSILASMKDSATRFWQGVGRFIHGLGARAIVALLFVVGMMLTSMILFFGTAGVTKTQASMLDKQAQQDDPAEQIPLGVTMAKNIVQDLELFAKKLGTKNIAVKQDKDSVSIDAELSRAQGAELERELQKYTRDYGDFVQLKATLRMTQEQKIVDDISVAQIVLGKAPAVILRDGAMLFEGGRYNGLTISSISTDRVILKGSTTYEVML